MPDLVVGIWGAIASVGMTIAAIKCMKDAADYQARKEAEDDGDQDA
jgi:hypothetical protein